MLLSNTSRFVGAIYPTVDSNVLHCSSFVSATDFVLQMIPKNDGVWSLAESYIDGIPSNSRKFKSSKIRRAKLYAWLSTREMPSRMGLAVTKGDLDFGGKLTKQFAEWLTNMFK